MSGRASPHDGLVPDGHDILRLPKPPPDFVPDDFRPSGVLFVPSPDDKAHALKHSRAVRVSVWDCELTTLAEACSFRGEPEVIVLRARAGDVVVASADAGGDVSVVYDLLEAPDSEWSGAAGHAGIEGLDRPAGASRTVFNALREAVADCFDLVPG